MPQDRLRYLEGLAAVSQAMNATLDPDRVLQTLAEEAAYLLELPSAAVLLVENRRLRVRASCGLSPTYCESQCQPLEGSIAGRALSEGRIFAAWDVRQTADASAAAAAAEGIVSVICAPMLFRGEPVGALSLYCHEPHCFSEDAFHALSLLAAQGAVAVTNARLYQESRLRAAEVRASFRRVGAALASSLDFAEAQRLIVRLAVEMTRAEAGALFLLADAREGGGLVLSAWRGLDGLSVRRFRRVLLSPMAERALAERRPIAVPDTRRYSHVAFPALRSGADDAREARSAVCVPILVGGRPVGVLEQYAGEPGRFDRDEIHLLSSFALHAAVAIENARLYEQERNVAQTLQRTFLPELPRAIRGFQIGRIYAPANEAAAVGGDTYDLFELPDGRITAMIADVCGKGTFAATLTVMAKFTARAYALEDPDPSRVLARLNEAVLAQTDDTTFLTVCYALLDPRSRSITVASAGHPPALFCRPGVAACRPLGSAPGMLAGSFPGEEYVAESAVFAPGDVLVFYTDGVLEARRRKAMYGPQRLQRVIEAHAGKEAQEIAGAILSDVLDFSGNNLTDDLALLVLKAE